MRPFLMPALALGLTALLPSEVKAIAIVIDDFTVPSTVTDITGGGSDTIGPVAGAGLGNGRLTTVESIAGGGSITAATQICSIGGGDCMSYNADSANQGLFSLEYDDIGGLDITDGGNNDLFRIATVSSEAGGSFTITVNDTGVGSSSFTGTIPFLVGFNPQPPGQPSPQFIDVLFTSFTGTADLTDLDTITFDFGPFQAGEDLEFSFLTATSNNVPEPLTILGTLAAGAFGVAMKKKKQAS